MGSNLGAEPRSAEGLVVVWPSTMREQRIIDYRSVLSLSMSAFTTLGLPARKRSVRVTKRYQLEFTV